MRTRVQSAYRCRRVTYSPHRQRAFTRSPASQPASSTVRPPAPLLARPFACSRTHLHPGRRMSASAFLFTRRRRCRCCPPTRCVVVLVDFSRPRYWCLQGGGGRPPGRPVARSDDRQAGRQAGRKEKKGRPSRRCALMVVLAAAAAAAAQQEKGQAEGLGTISTRALSPWGQKHHRRGIVRTHERTRNGRLAAGCHRNLRLPVDRIAPRTVNYGASDAAQAAEATAAAAPKATSANSTATARRRSRPKQRTKKRADRLVRSMAGLAKGLKERHTDARN